jgi:hypothetical protein
MTVETPHLRWRGQVNDATPSLARRPRNISKRDGEGRRAGLRPLQLEDLNGRSPRPWDCVGA